MARVSIVGKITTEAIQGLNSCTLTRKPPLADRVRLWVRIPVDTALQCLRSEPIIQGPYDDARAMVTLYGNLDLAAAYRLAIKSRAVKLWRPTLEIPGRGVPKIPHTIPH